MTATYLHPRYRLSQQRQAALLRKLNAEATLRDRQAECTRTGRAWRETDSDADYSAYCEACDRFGDARRELAEARGEYDFAKFDCENA